MCCSCGCGRFQDRHDFSPSIIWSQIEAAAKYADISPKECVQNMVSAAEQCSQIGCDVVKASDEKRYTLGIAYPANRADTAKAADGFRDFAGPDALESAAWSFMRKGAKVGLNHQHGTDGAGTVVESYIWPQGAPDWPQPNGYVVKSGDWLLGVVWDEPAWADIKQGRLTGFSPQGGARRRTPSAEALAQLRS